jgi:hypothetical protein
MAKTSNLKLVESFGQEPLRADYAPLGERSDLGGAGLKSAGDRRPYADQTALS